MVTQFYIVFEDKSLDSFKLKHIQYNIQKRLQKLKYVTYKRVDIYLTANRSDKVIDIGSGDGKTARITCLLDKNVVINVEAKGNIAVLYQCVFDCLLALWSKNGWDTNDLHAMHNEIKAEQFFSSLFYGKTIASPDKGLKADFYCELYPDYTDYFFNVVDKKGNQIWRIQFLKGHQDPVIFFGFFSNSNWKDNQYFLLADTNKEIFFVFNVSTADFAIEYRPIYNSLEQCQQHLQAFQANLTQSERMKFLGLPF